MVMMDAFLAWDACLANESVSKIRSFLCCHVREIDRGHNNMDIWGSRLFQQQLSLAQLNWEPSLSGKLTRGKRMLRLIMDDGKILGTIVVRGKEIAFPEFLTIEVSTSSDHLSEAVCVPISELTRETLRERIREELRW